MRSKISGGVVTIASLKEDMNKNDLYDDFDVKLNMFLQDVNIITKNIAMVMALKNDNYYLWKYTSSVFNKPDYLYLYTTFIKVESNEEIFKNICNMVIDKVNDLVLAYGQKNPALQIYESISEENVNYLFLYKSKMFMIFCKMDQNRERVILDIFEWRTPMTMFQHELTRFKKNNWKIIYDKKLETFKLGTLGMQTDFSKLSPSKRSVVKHSPKTPNYDISSLEPDLIQEIIHYYNPNKIYTDDEVISNMLHLYNLRLVRNSNEVHAVDARS